METRQEQLKACRHVVRDRAPVHEQRCRGEEVEALLCLDCSERNVGDGELMALPIPRPESPIASLIRTA